MTADNLGGLRRLAAYEPVFGDPGFSPGTWEGGRPGEHGVIQMPWFSYNETVDRFHRELAALEWIYPFDWPAWAATPEGGRLISDPDAIATASAADLAKVLTSIVRGDRFHEGALAAAFERGTIGAITRRAAELVLELESANGGEHADNEQHGDGGRDEGAGQHDPAAESRCT